MEAAEKSGSCADSAGAGCWAGTEQAELAETSFQSVAAPQRLQKRRTPSLVAQTSASTLVSSIFSRALQEVQAREMKPRSFSRPVMGGKSISQKLRLKSKKATP